MVYLDQELWQKSLYLTVFFFIGSVKVVDNKELNSDITIKFKLDDLSKSKSYKCNSQDNDDGFSKDNLECTETDNDDKIWVKVWQITHGQTFNHIILI